MSDLSCLYYTANRISPRFGDAVRAELVRSIGGRFPIICVSHAPLDFGDVRIVVGDVQPSIVQVYRNILAGCRASQTPFCAAAEDDSLYVSDHWDYRPPIDTFAYNENRVVLTRRLSDDGKRREAFYYSRPRTQMAMGVFPTALMVSALEEKFSRYPDPPLDTTVAKKSGFGEPGRYEKLLGLSPRKLHRFKWTDRPNATVNHSLSLMGRRRWQPDDPVFHSVEPWGEANALWRRLLG